MSVSQEVGDVLGVSLGEVHRSVVDHFKKNTGEAALLLFLIVSFLVASAGYTPHAVGATKPNFVFIMADDMPASMLEVMPNTKSLIQAQGMTFNRAYVETALCCPSRSTFLTGLYAHNHKVFQNDNQTGGFKVFKAQGLENRTFVIPLQAAGYQTALFGKYINNYGSTANGGPAVPPGWTRWFGSISNFKDSYNWSVSNQGVWKQYGSTTSDYITDVLLAQSKAFLTENATSTKPFFLYFSVSAPHEPAISAKRHENMFASSTVPRTPAFNEEDMSDKPSFLQQFPLLTPDEIATRDQHYADGLRSMQAVDEAVKSIYNLLKSQGKLANTYFIFTSDHGSHFGERRAPEGKQLPYEEDIRVPLIIRGPNVRVNYVDTDHLVVNADWAPTILRLAGLTTSPDIDGRAMRPLIDKNVALGEPWRNMFSLARWRAPNDNLAPYPDFTGVKTAKYTYVEWKNGEKELYDLTVDPYEINNVASSTAYAATMAQFAAINAGLQTCAGNTCRELERQAAPQ
jgi:N-acetylglucosamine-6-sulfatase